MIFILFTLLFMHGIIHAQSPISVGERGHIVISDITQDSAMYTVKLSNSSVFFIDSISIGDNPQDLQRITADSISWQGNGLGKLTLHGLALAGSDSMTLSRITGRLQDSIVIDTSILIRISSVNTPLPYVRFSVLSDNIPNPVMRGEATTWSYAIDNPGKVSIAIITLDGRIIEEFSMMQDRGIHAFEFIPNAYTYHPGVYGMRLITEQGIFHRLWNVSP
ncbi:MAG: hypothetical protein ACKOAK_10960 [Ignavibacteria bacterium]